MLERFDSPNLPPRTSRHVDENSDTGYAVVDSYSRMLRISITRLCVANLYILRPDAKQIIEDAGLTQIELAERAGIARESVRNAIHRGMRLRGATAWRIAQALAEYSGIPREQAFAALLERVEPHIGTPGA